MYSQTLLNAELQLLGLSRDGRTNRWNVTCPHCKHSWEPPTTMMGKEVLLCEKRKCGKEFFAHYNAEIDRLAKKKQEQ